MAAAAFVAVLLGSFALAALYDEMVDAFGFDRRYRIDTGIFGKLAGGVSADALPCRGYMPTPVRTVRSLLSALPIDPREFTLIDLGSGKGRALLVGAECGFARCIGIERSAALCRTSLANLLAWRRVTGSAIPVDVHCSDAGEFAFPETPLVIYLYNPFPRAIMAQVARNLARSHAAVPRCILIVTVHPRYDSELVDAGFLQPLELRGATTDFYSAFEAASAAA